MSNLIWWGLLLGVAMLGCVSQMVMLDSFDLPWKNIFTECHLVYEHCWFTPASSVCHGVFLGSGWNSTSGVLTSAGVASMGAWVLGVWVQEADVSWGTTTSSSNFSSILCWRHAKRSSLLCFPARFWLPSYSQFCFRATTHCSLCRSRMTRSTNLITAPTFWAQLIGDVPHRLVKTLTDSPHCSKVLWTVLSFFAVSKPMSSQLWSGDMRSGTGFGRPVLEHFFKTSLCVPL